ncbi:MAG: UvrD-helicase domain-containing protein [Isosphaeraceae bacterium]
MTTKAQGSGSLTVEQSDALAVKGKSVALGAGAGCGKTTVLTERFLAEIDGPDGRALRELVALTFTDKAARELRERIRSRCRERLAGGADNTRWRSVLRALEAAPIGTFHEFAGGLLRSHAIELGIDPEFVIVDEAVASSLRDQAVRTTIRQLLARLEPDLTLPATDYGLRPIREALLTLLATRTAGDLDTWGQLESRDLVDRWTQVWEEQGRPAVLRGLAPIARCCRDLLLELDAAHPKLQTRRAELLERLPDLERATCSDADLAEIRRLARVNDLGAKGIWPAPEVKEAVKGVFESLRKRIDDAIKKVVINQALTLESAETSLRLIRLAARARAEYERVKNRRGSLDFDDLLVKTRDLLTAEPELEERTLALRDAIEFVLVDEFQDTDRVQSEILRRLGDSSFFHSRMFVVGDTKQSIYRFRGAEPAIFDRWRGEFPEPGRLNLTENFRSVPGVIDFVNALFAECFPGDRPGPKAGEGPRLIARRSDHSGSPAVTFLWALPSPEEDETGKPRRLTVDERRTNEARGLARWIRERLDADWTIVDRKSRQPRRAVAGDVAFLFRAMTDVWYYETALADVDLDYHTVGGSAFYAQQEVRDIVNVLSAVEDPFDEVSIAAALRGPFFSLSDAGLFWLASRFEGGLAEGILRAGEIAELTDRDRGLATRAANLLSRWRDLKDRVPLATLVATILDESGFEAALVCEFLGPRKLANTRKLVRLARDFDRQQGFTLADLVARLRADLDRPPREEQAATTGEESPAIRLMSIHQAKGLEFPIVVVPDLNRNSNPPRSLVGLHPELGLAVRPPRTPALPGENDAEPASGDSQGWLAFGAIEAEEDRKEALRLFYVATTRARDHLVLSAGLEVEPDGSDPAAVYLSSLGSCCSQNPGNPRAYSPAMQLLLERFDWRSGGCLARLPGDWPAPRVNVILAAPTEPERQRRRSPRRRLEQIEQAITSARVCEPQPALRSSSPPGLIDLDPDPPTPSRQERIGRLIRALLADKGLLLGEPLAEVCARLASRQVPAASSSIQRDAVRRLETWRESPLFHELRDASRGRRAIEHGLRWILPWPADGTAATVIRGRFDLLFRDRKGSWRPVIVSTDAAGRDADHLCLLLAGRAIDRLGTGPGAPSWWVEVGAGSELIAEARLSASPATIDEAIDRWLTQHCLASLRT